MHFEGKHDYATSPEVLWRLLNDPDVLTRVTPAAQRLDSVGPDSYEATFQVKLGPISSKFSGTLAVTDKTEPERYTLLVSQNSPMGNVKGEFLITLTDQGGQTELSFAGDAKISGRVAGIGARVLSGVSKFYTGQFFQAIEKEVAAATT